MIDIKILTNGGGKVGGRGWVEIGFLTYYYIVSFM